MNRHVVVADVDLTLMVMDSNGDHRPSNVATYQYFLAVDDSFLTNLTENALAVLNRVYLEHRQRFREQEPNDPNYIAVVGLRATVLPEKDEAAQPWTSARRPLWEPAICIIVQDGQHTMVSLERFHQHLRRPS